MPDKTTAPAATTSSTETTVAKDSQLAINNPAVTAQAAPQMNEAVDFTPPASSQPVSAAVGEGKEEPFITVKEAVAAPEVAPIVAAGAPVVVSEQETKAAEQSDSKITPPAEIAINTPSSPKSDMESQIETLTGEIQALEAKIERLTSGAQAETKDDGKMMEKPQTESKVDEEKTAIVTPPSSTPVESSELTDTKKGAKSPAVTFNDIYSKQADQIKNEKAELSHETSESTVLNEGTSHSPLAIIGEVLAVFGIITLVLLLLSPLYKEIIGSEVFATIKSIGWLTTLMSLGLGTLLLLFGKGKGFLKVAVILFLVITVVLYLGIMGPNIVATPLNTVFGPLLDFYR